MGSLISVVFKEGRGENVLVRVVEVTDGQLIEYDVVISTKKYQQLKKESEK